MFHVSLDQLDTFLCVADRGSFSAAGRELGRAQSAVSYAIQTLERALGVTLFERVGRRPELTREGRALLAEAREIRAGVDRLAERATSFVAGVEPELSIAVDVSFSDDTLICALADFERKFPTVALRLHSEALGGVTQLVLSGECQLGVGMALPGRDGELLAIPLTVVTLLPVAAPSHPLARAPGPIATRSARRERQIVLSDRSALTAGRDFRVIGERTWRVADQGVKRALIRAGFGWGSLPEHVARADLQAGLLVELSLAAWPAGPDRVELFALHRPRQALGPAARWLIERLREPAPSPVEPRAPAAGSGARRRRQRSTETARRRTR